MPIVFSPVTGLNDITQFPDDDPAIRAHIQALLQQIPDYADATKASKTQDALTVPTLINSYTFNIPGGYYKDTVGAVHLCGRVTGGSAVNVFVLPVGYRPSITRQFSGVINNAFSMISIASDGTVYVPSGSYTNVGLDNISFRAEQ